MGSKKPWDKRRILVQQLLRQMREHADLLQTDLAGRLKKDQSFVSRYERGERRLDLVEIDEICRACGSKLSDLVKQYEAEAASAGRGK